MKKLLSIMLLTAVVVSGIYSQDTTWTNPYAFEIPGSLSNVNGFINTNIPHSMISAVSNGTEYDGIDVLLQSPSELSEFEGVTFYTAYGNYTEWNKKIVGMGTTVENPFTSLSGPVGNFLLGYLMPAFGFQSGVVAGFNISETSQLSGYDTTDSTYSEESSATIDANIIGTADYTESESFSYTNKVLNNSMTLGMGVDLGFMGVSLYTNIEDMTNTIGGTYEYTLSPGADADYLTSLAASNTTTSKTIEYGYKDGEAASDAVKSGGFDFTVKGQLPFSIADISMPLTASVNFGTFWDGNSANMIAQKVTIKDIYSTGNGNAPLGAVDNVSTLSYTQGVSDLNSATTSAGDISGLINAATWTIANGLSKDVYADDAEKISDYDFSIGFDVQADPKFKVSDVLTARTRAKLDMDFIFSTDNQAGVFDINFSEASSNATPATYSYSSSKITESGTNTSIVGLEIGGILEAKSSTGFLTVSSGLFYNPTFIFSTTTKDPTVEKRTVSANDELIVNEATSATTINTGLATDIGLNGGVEGTYTEVTKTSYSGDDVDNTYINKFIIPISVRLNLKKDKLSLIGGYVLQSSIEHNVVETAGTNASEVTTTIMTSDGTDVSQVASTDVSSASPVATILETHTSNPWAGAMNFMLRWTPNSELTVDFFGNSLMNALNMDIFSGGSTSYAGANDGLNFHYFISTLGLSVTYKM